MAEVRTDKSPVTNDMPVRLANVSRFVSGVRPLAWLQIWFSVVLRSALVFACEAKWCKKNLNKGRDDLLLDQKFFYVWNLYSVSHTSLFIFQKFLNIKGIGMFECCF